MVSAIDAVCDVTRSRYVSTDACDEALCRRPRPSERHQASARLQDVGIDLPRISQRTRTPKKAEGETPGKPEYKPVSPAQMLYAKNVAQGKGVVIPEEAKADSVAVSAWIDSNRSGKLGKRGRKSGYKLASRVDRGSIDGDDEEVSETQS